MNASRTRNWAAALLAWTAFLVPSACLAQSRGDQPGDRTPATQPAGANSTLVTRMMAFDKNGDGKLSKEEVTDERLLRLFDRADANGDGVVTKEELAAVAAKEPSGGGRGFGGPGSPGGPAGPGGFDDRGGPGSGGPGGPGGRGGRGPGFGPPQPGTVLSTSLQDRLNLSDDQKKQLQELQADVDKRLGAILTKEQSDELKQMRSRGPGGPGGRGGPDGPPGDRMERGPTSRPAEASRP